MTNQPEGIIKYHCDWTKKPLEVLTVLELEKFNYWRSKLRERGVIGVDVTGIGYGNISMRVKVSKDFIITGSQTGHLNKLSPNELSLVTDYDILNNYIRCSGLIKASSEALTHAAIYTNSLDYKAVIHIHSHKIWKLVHEIYPVTDPKAEYGTPEMALSIEQLLTKTFDCLPQIIILGGHPDGIIICGSTLDSTGSKTIELLDNFE
ncbi:MAG: class II aldolase/adducin family protein [Candidatus Cloacimonetes bacterium]|nr:class II aldolase/adducin family protein [Candidatus Cloacimonadota bacterium]